MSGKRILLKIGSDSIEIPEEQPSMRDFAGEFYKNMENLGVELKEGLDFLSIEERAKNLFLCG